MQFALFPDYQEEAARWVVEEAPQKPVLLLYLYDGDLWGYDFYGGKE